MRLKVGQNLRDIAEMRAKDGNGNLRDVTMIVAKVGNQLRVVWKKVVDTISGWVFTSGRPISVSGRYIRLNGQN